MQKLKNSPPCLLISASNKFLKSSCFLSWDFLVTSNLSDKIASLFLGGAGDSVNFVLGSKLLDEGFRSSSDGVVVLFNVFLTWPEDTVAKVKEGLGLVFFFKGEAGVLAIGRLLLFLCLVWHDGESVTVGELVTVAFFR